MKKTMTFTWIGFISGGVLALFLKLIEVLFGSKSYYLLFDVSYMPFIKTMTPAWLIGTLFHFMTCIVSLAVLFFILKRFNLEYHYFSYILPITLGSAILYILTIFSTQTPNLLDFWSWLFWVLGHIVFTLTAVYLIRQWVKPKKEFDTVSKFIAD